jgi:hypothetical protein
MKDNIDLIAELWLHMGGIVWWLWALLHGALWNETSIRIVGNSFHASTALRRKGVHARPFLPRVRGDQVGVIDVKRKQKKLAMLVLRQMGYECW